MAFSGTFDYTLDAKNRLTVPAKMRAQLSQTLVLARGTAQCLTIWPQQDFDAYVLRTFEGLGPLDRRRDELSRFFYSNSFDTQLDSAGRVPVPVKLMEFAGIEKDVVVNGAFDRIEVWDRATWETHNDALDFEALAATLPGAGGLPA